MNKELTEEWETDEKERWGTEINVNYSLTAKTSYI